MTGLSIGITTRDRPAALRRCVRSIVSVLGPADPLAPWPPDLEILVFDDNSVLPASEQLGPALAARVRVLRDTRGPGYIAGRNALVRAAAHGRVLLLDDDAMLIERQAIERAIAVIDGDPRVAAVAFAQAERDGRPWPAAMQPGIAAVPAAVSSYIGFAHLLRRDVFLEHGGYRDEFVCYGEEKDYCLRLMDAGYRVVYLPDALVRHVVDPGGRDERRYVRYVIRNDCLMSLYNEPWPLVLVGLPLRLLRFRRMAASIAGGDAGGVRWIAGELRRAWTDVRRRRQPVSWATIREWRRLSRSVVPYDSPS